MVTWTTEQVLALAPDASSAKNGKALAAGQKWVSLGQCEAAVWGECQGSGKTPYQTQVDLSEPAFNCSCPSRKFPCKHGLGLLLLFVGQPSILTQTAPPDWVEGWLTKRAKRQQDQQDQSEKKTAQAVDTVAQAKRAIQREAKVQAGIQELNLWLSDRLRQGLASIPTQPYRFWETPAARMVDAQAPGLARQLREIAGIAYTGQAWPDTLLKRLGLLHLLLEGYQRLEQLPPATQADLRTLVGWTQNQEELLAAAPDQVDIQSDRWLILGRHLTEEDRLKVQRTWLWGVSSQRPALILSFAHGHQSLDVSLMPGTVLQAELVFFPSRYPLRALVKTRQTSPEPMTEFRGYSSLAIAFEVWLEALSRQPWLDNFPLPLAEMKPVPLESRWLLQDQEGRCVPLAQGFSQPWELLALSGGHPVGLFGEWRDEELLPLSVFAHGRFYGF
jgi:hypothetical protein